jgi:pimeloyl-ACP methyl ester carboxylesterase
MFLEITIPEKIKLEYAIFGEGEPLVFLHGGGTNFHFYEPFFDKLGKKYKIYTFSYPGFGLSSSMKSFTIENLVKVVDSFIKAMGLKEFTLMGQSMGGGIATYFASHQDKYKIKSLILLCPATTPIEKSILQLIKDTKSQHSIELKFDKDYFNMQNEYYQVNGNKFKSRNLKYPISILKLIKFIYSTNFIDKYETLTMPIKLFWGDKDLTLGANTFEKAWNNLNRNNVSVTIFKGYGHNFFFPKHKEIIEAI